MLKPAQPGQFHIYFVYNFLFVTMYSYIKLDIRPYQIYIIICEYIYNRDILKVSVGLAGGRVNGRQRHIRTRNRAKDIWSIK